MSTIIDPKRHTFAQALACKRDNTTLSPRTLKKLTMIANRQFGGSAERVFGAADRRGYNGDAAALRTAISSQLATVRSPALKQVMHQWLGRLPTPRVPEGTLPVAQFAPGARITAWLASAHVSAVPAAGIPEPDYDEIPVIPPVDYEQAYVAVAPEIPPPDYPRVSFSEDVTVIHLPPVEPRETH